MEEMKVITIVLICLCVLIFPFFPYLYGDDSERHRILEEETKAVLERCHRLAAQFYTLDEGEDLKELTQIILESSDTKESLKDLIRTTDRRFILFHYPSDDFKVKGVMSFVPNAEQNPLLIFLRGGNKIFGLMHPANDFSCTKDYTVITTTYRGGVSEGTDEYGGAEVADVENLLNYFPTLQSKLDLQLSPKKIFILGASRGGLEMFLALNRSPSLQYRVSKAVSLCGLLDLEFCMADREDMVKMFANDFGFDKGADWVQMRNPIHNLDTIRRDLPFLILQGTADNRVPLDEGYHMVKALEAQGNPVTYLEFPGGDHCLVNQPDRITIITDWLETP